MSACVYSCSCQVPVMGSLCVFLFMSGSYRVFLVCIPVHIRFLSRVPCVYSYPYQVPVVGSLCVFLSISDSCRGFLVCIPVHVRFMSLVPCVFPCPNQIPVVGSFCVFQFMSDSCRGFRARVSRSQKLKFFSAEDSEPLKVRAFKSGVSSKLAFRASHTARCVCLFVCLFS